MQCPKCKIPLTREIYEGLPIHGCKQCLGHLLSAARLKAIKTRRDKKIDDFRSEIKTERVPPQAGDTAERLRCPKCRSGMEKRSKPFGPTEFHIDLCRRCDLYWLDVGELAKLQLIYEYSEQGRESERIRQRLENMTPEEKAEFEKRIAALPNPSFVEELMTSYVTEGYGSRWDAYYGVWSMYDDD